MRVKDFETRLHKVRESHGAAFHGLAVEAPSANSAKQEQKNLINRTLRELAQLRREIVQAEKNERTKSSQKLGKARAKSHALQVTLWGRSAGGTARADEKRMIGRQRDRKLGPYGQVKLDLDDTVRKLRDARDQL